MTTDKKWLILARERGLCGGVRNALTMLNKLITDNPGEKIYVLHELVHNRHVTEDFRQRGVVFVSSLDEVPAKALLLLGAHGVTPDVEEKARRITGRLSDACCPLVRDRQRAAAELDSGDTLILTGSPGHPEVVGILGWSNAGENIVIQTAEEVESLLDIAHPVLISQTTFAEDEFERCRESLLRRFPHIRCYSGPCVASKNRQQSVDELARLVDMVVVVGSRHSSNVRRLCEKVERSGSQVLMVDASAELGDNFVSFRKLGLTAGASTPDEDVEEIAAVIAAAGFEIFDLKNTDTERVK